jgi:HSF-type DNA-binding
MSVVLSFPVTEMEGEQKKNTDKQPHLFLSSQDGKESDDVQGAPSPVDSQSGAAASVARIDDARANDPDEHDEEARIEAPGADSTKTFPQKVESMIVSAEYHAVVQARSLLFSCSVPHMQLMDVLDNPRFSESISWLPHGKGFVVTDKKRFASEVLPLYFGVQTKFTSFTRKLNRW